MAINLLNDPSHSTLTMLPFLKQICGSMMIDAHSYFILITFYKIQFHHAVSDNEVLAKIWQTAHFGKTFMGTSRFRAVWIRVDTYLWAESNDLTQWIKRTNSLNLIIWLTEPNYLSHKIKWSGTLKQMYWLTESFHLTHWIKWTDSLNGGGFFHHC